MSPLDDVLQQFNDNPEEAHQAFYEKVLNTELYVPLKEALTEENPETVSPMILEADGKGYVMVFDSEERLNAWAGQEAPHVIYTGFQLVQQTPDTLYWALNVGSEQTKEFVPQEIDMLKQVIAAHLKTLNPQ